MPGDWIILDDLRIRSAQSQSGYAQIDHVVISPQVVYCIETKNWRGRYLRTEQGWITKYKLEQGIHEFKKDPVPQARSHATALEDALKSLQLNVPVYPVIVFTNNDFEYLGRQGDVPVTAPNFLIHEMLSHSLPPVAPDTIAPARKLLELHRDARPK